MIETAIQNTAITQHITPDKQARKILRWEYNERMGGRIPVWDTAKTAKDKVAMELAAAAAPQDSSFGAAMAYADATNGVHPDEAFGFGDIIDMVNPLHHLPIVGHVYREVTGDQIKPISRIIGGGVFGGGVGAAGGLIDTVIEYETGTDMAGNAMGLVTNGKVPQFRDSVAKSVDAKGTGSVVSTLSEPLTDTNDKTRLGSALGFADLSHQEQSQTESHRKRVPVADGRTAGYRYADIKTFEDQNIAYTMPQREPITEIVFDKPL